MKKLIFSTINKARPFLKILPTSSKTYIREKYISKLIKENCSYQHISHKPDFSKGVNLIGFPFRYSGIGQNLRYYIDDLEKKNIPFSIIDYDNEKDAKTSEFVQYVKYLETSPKYPTNIWCFNFHNMRLAFYEKGKEFFENYYNIGYFQWEYEFVDPKFKNDLSLCDEIWGISDFVTKSLKQLNIDVPHKTCLIPVKVGTTKFKRENYNFPNNKKIFFYAFDFNSSLERKNPQALIDAFQLAFKNHLKNDILLVLKVHSPSKKNKDYIKFKNLIANDDRIFLVEDLLSYSEMIGLVNAVDVVVSLHRSEGYGMLMHEAQLLGKYVIATGYSANIEFMQGHKKSFLVDYKIIPKNDNKKYFWANPDINDAASKLMLVYDLIKD